MSFREPIVARSLVDQVTTAVRGSILGGELKPGSRFSITELASGLGVSTIPVREALERLEGQGLIVRRRGRTAIVSPLSTDELKEIYELRIAVECEAAGMAARALTDDDARRLEGCLDAMRGGSPRDENFWLRHHEFHRGLLAPALTPWRERILSQLWQAVERYVRVIYTETGFDTRVTPYERHCVLLEAARARSSSQLKKRLAEHYRENLRWMLDALITIGNGTPPQ